MAVEIRPKQSSLAVKVERNDHSTLTHRNEPNQHKIDAITGLAEALSGLNTLIVSLQEQIDTHSASSTEVIENLTEKLVELVQNSVRAEEERALEKEEALDSKFTEKITSLSVNTEKETKRLDQNVIALGNELSARVNELQAVEYELNVKLDDEVIRARKAEIELDDKIKEEIARAQSGEEKLYDLLSIEANRAINQEKVLTQNLEAETRRAIDAEEKLDLKISTNKEKIMSVQDILVSKIIAEKDRAESEESELSTKIGKEIERSTLAEQDLEKAISREQERAELAEANLQSQLNSEIDRSKIEETSLFNKITAEQERAEKAETTITNELKNEISRSKEAEFNLNTALADEIKRATEVENKIINTLEIEETRAILAEEGLTNRINEEANRAKTEEVALKLELDKEYKRAIDAELSLGTRIDTEVERFKGEAERLNLALEEEIERSTAKENLLSSNIESAEKHIENVKLELELNIDNEVSRAKREEEQLNNRINKEKARLDSEITTRILEDTALRNYIDEHISEVDLRTDVIDVVATKADLELYDKTKITENDIIKVLSDETFYGATTYYRLVKNIVFNRNEFELVGSIGPYYTTAEINAQTRYLRDENIDFGGIKSFVNIKSNQIPAENFDLANKLYVDTEIVGVQTALGEETTRAVGAEAALETLINENIDNLEETINTLLDAKADLVGGKVPEAQIPDSVRYSSVFEAPSRQDFPPQGISGRLYVDAGENIIYR